MRRKVTYYAALLATLLLTVLPGCGRKDLPQPEEGAILFSAAMVGVSSAPVKSDPAATSYPSYEADFIKEGTTISVYGSWTSPTNVSSDVLRGVELTCHETGQVSPAYEWTYSPLRYWRSEGSYTFGSVYPADARVEYGTSGGKLVATYSMLADDYDLMVASTKRQMTGEGSTATVPLVFHHACAAVRFLFRKADLGSADYFVDSFELQNISAVGRLVANWVITNPGTEDEAEEYQINWTPSEAKSSGIYAWQAADESEWINVPTDYVTNPETPTEIEKWHFVIPQKLLGDGVTHPTLEFSIHVGDDPTPVYTHLYLPEENTPEYSDPTPIYWEPGKMYTYLVQIQPSKAYIEVEVMPWDEYYLGVDDITF